MPQLKTREIGHSWLGEALVKDGKITSEQLDRALRVQRYLEQPRQLGAILVELGYVNKREILDALSRHGAGIRLGDMLLEQGLISTDTLEQALRIQQEKQVKIGQALVELGAMNERTLLQNLAHQAGVPFIEPNFSMIEPALLSGVSPEYLERFGFIPFSRNDEGNVTVIVSDIRDERASSAVHELFREKCTFALGPTDAIHQAIEDYRRFRHELAQQRTVQVGSDSVVQLVDHIFGTAIEDRASDIHIEPMANLVRLRYRIDGALVYKTDLPKDLLPRLSSRLKVLAECNITEHQRHQGGRILYDHQSRQYDMRLSSYVTVHGECIVLRILNKQSVLIDLEELGMCGSMLERFRHEVLEMPSGVVLITGPTGSGKTTTLYSSLNFCNSLDTKIITAEDPVEYLIDGLIQCSINEKAGRTFETTLREMVRQDPDIIVLGEIRDRITAQTAIQAALTGHKVYSTFHTEDTIGGLLRLIDMDIETFLISSTVISVVAQRLLRRTCNACATPYVPTVLELDKLGLQVDEVRDYEFMKGRGCKKCNYTGYYGRVGVYELLILNEAVKDSILQKRSAHFIRQTCMDSTGLISMCEDGIGKAVRGFTTFEEVIRRAPRTFRTRPVRQILTLTH
jgi:type IV pilus assembly protein PilB